MCLPCLGGAADDVVVTPDPVSTSQFIHMALSAIDATVFMFLVLLQAGKDLLYFLPACL